MANDFDEISGKTKAEVAKDAKKRHKKKPKKKTKTRK